MSRNRDRFPNPPIFDSDDLSIAKLIGQVGWTEDEFLDAFEDCRSSVTNYNWEASILNLWNLTQARIHSQLDLTFRFLRYTRWAELIPFALSVNRRRLMCPRNHRDLTYLDLVQELLRQKKSELLPLHVEKLVVWAIVHLIVQLHSFLWKHPQAALDQLTQLRDAAQKRKEDAERRREARYHRRQAQKQKKRGRR